MKHQLTKAIREDFANWTGGFPPESDQQVWVYVEVARPEDTDADEVTRLLLDWLAAEEHSDW